ncbi:MAG: hypothetical protein ACKPKO_06735, partial [Candidatus Fonsibacter sp.]
ATQRRRFSFNRAENKRKVLAASVSLTADPRTQVAMKRYRRRRLLHSKDSKFVFNLRHNSSQPRNTVCMLAHKLCMMCNVPAIVGELGKTKAVAGARLQPAVVPVEVVDPAAQARRP